MNSAPPSIRSSSSRRCASSSGSIRVCVGSPGTFSTRKWRSATLAICGQVRDRDDLRPLGEPAQGLGDRVRGRPPMPASISSKTIVSPPPTAAIASAIRDSSPPEAVSATGANGRPAFGRIRNDDLVGARRARVALARARPGTRRRPGRCPGARARPPRRTAPRPIRVQQYVALLCGLDSSSCCPPRACSAPVRVQTAGRAARSCSYGIAQLQPRPERSRTLPGSARNLSGGRIEVVMEAVVAITVRRSVRVQQSGRTQLNGREA